MAAFEYAFESAGTPKSYNIFGGLTAIDEAGDLTPSVVQLVPGANVVMVTPVTDAQLVEGMLLFIRRYGAGHDGAGGFPVQATRQILLGGTNVPAAD